MHEAAKIGDKGQVWPKQYRSARYQYETNLARAAADAASKAK
jgi:anthraniloyl-CoA monooxygenase